jgi:hypothetical protein
MGKIDRDLDHRTSEIILFSFATYDFMMFAIAVTHVNWRRSRFVCRMWLQYFPTRIDFITKNGEVDRTPPLPVYFPTTTRLLHDNSGLEVHKPYDATSNPGGW